MFVAFTHGKYILIIELNCSFTEEVMICTYTVIYRQCLNDY
jgi:hypothetical protein